MEGCLNIFLQFIDKVDISELKPFTVFLGQGKMPMMMFGLPAAALAIYRTSPPEKKAKVKALMIAGVAASIVSGITEPLEFSFMFIAPPLYLFHALMGGLSFMLMSACNVIIGNTGGGLIDFLIWGVFQPGSHWYWVLITGPFFSVAYYYVFKWYLTRKQLSIDVSDEEPEQETRGSSHDEKQHILASRIIEETSGDGRISWWSNNCLTRLRVDLKDMALVSEYVSDLAKKYNTAYTKRKFMTSYGREVEVSGVYGWRINQTAETAALTEIIRSGESQTREPEYSQKAASHDGNDYGNTYAEVNLTAQHLFFYKDGEKILESDFVSGNVSRGYTTPPGLFSLTYKQKDAVLRGEGYASPVDFWMPFNGGIGFHDASWRNQFGGTIYKTNGSHGCINMPYNAAKTLYENVYAGMPVICYNLEGTENTKSTSASGSAAAETQPTTAAAETQPTTAAAETQPTTAAAETQPTTAAAETQPTTAAAETQPTTAAAETQPQTPPGPGGETEYGPGMDLTGPGISYGPGGQNASGPGSTTGS